MRLLRNTLTMGQISLRRLSIDRLKGEDIPLEARIMSLADVYDALISDRVYKKAYSKEQSINIILEGRGTQFDPLLTDLFVEAVREID